MNHMHVMGASGTGKSKFLELHIRHDFHHGRCVVIDPHGTLYRSVLGYALQKGIKPTLFDLSMRDCLFGLNPFIGDPAYATDNLVEVFSRVWSESSHGTPLLRKNLRLLIYALAETKRPFTDALSIINTPDVEIKDPVYMAEWEVMKSLPRQGYANQFASIKNRLMDFFSVPRLRQVFETPSIPLRSRHLLCNLSGPDISADVTRTFGVLLLHLLLADAKRNKYPIPTMVYIDEAQMMMTEDVASILDQMRKYNFFLCLAHHHYGQIENRRVRQSIETNCDHFLFSGADDRISIPKRHFVKVLDEDAPLYAVPEVPTSYVSKDRIDRYIRSRAQASKDHKSDAPREPGDFWERKTVPPKVD